eukprot:8754855-Pyramimonas_sp.AAC.4
MRSDLLGGAQPAARPRIPVGPRCGPTSTRCRGTGGGPTIDDFMGGARAPRGGNPAAPAHDALRLEAAPRRPPRPSAQQVGPPMMPRPPTPTPPPPRQADPATPRAAALMPMDFTGLVWSANE